MDNKISKIINYLLLLFLDIFCISKNTEASENLIQRNREKITNNSKGFRQTFKQNQSEQVDTKESQARKLNQNFLLFALPQNFRFDKNEYFQKLTFKHSNLLFSQLIEKQPLKESIDCFSVSQINLEGNTILTEKLNKMLKPYQNRQVCWSELLSLAENLTQLYVSSGYVTSAVIIPEQELGDVIVFQAIEGKLEDIELIGLERVEENYVLGRIKRFVGEVVNVFEIEEALQFLQADSLFGSVEGELKQGSSFLSTKLVVNLVEAPPFQFEIGFDNYQSPLIGEFQGNVGFSLMNLTGWGDRVSPTFQWTEGSQKYFLDYFLPLNALSGGLRLFIESSNSRIILSELEKADVRWESLNYGIGWTQPIVNTAREEFSLGISLDFRESKSFILNDVPFSISEASVNGVTSFRVIRLKQDWVKQSATDFLILRTMLNFGLDAFNAKLSEDFDSNPVYLFGQFQYGKKLSENFFFITRLGFQLSAFPLPPIEQFEIGGAYTVRGYPRPTKLGDNGIFLANELQISLVNSPEMGNLQLVPFVDFGTVWQSNVKEEREDEGSLASVGIGVRYYYKDFVVVRLDYGIPLIDVEEIGIGLSKDGFNFAVYLIPFNF